MQHRSDRPAGTGRQRQRSHIENRQREGAEQQAQREQRQPEPQQSQRAVQQQAKGPCEQHRRNKESGDAETLPQEIGEHRPVMA